MEDRPINSSSPRSPLCLFLSAVTWPLCSSLKETPRNARVWGEKRDNWGCESTCPVYTTITIWANAAENKLQACRLCTAPHWRCVGSAGGKNMNTIEWKYVYVSEEGSGVTVCKLFKRWKVQHILFEIWHLKFVDAASVWKQLTVCWANRLLLKR